jgi:hypothetical protein
VSTTAALTHERPFDQPGDVQQIAGRLLPAYTVDGGRPSLAGCTLEDRPFLLLQPPAEAGIYLDAEGREVDGDPVAGLTAASLTPLVAAPQPLGPDFERLLAAGQRLADERWPAADDRAAVTFVAVWCKYAEGKIRFSVGESSADLPFSGWARTLTPPPFLCPYTGAATFHLGITDDGRIAAADAIARCAETGRRMLARELVACSLTGSRVVPSLVEPCAVSGRPVLRTRLVICETCRQKVSPAVLERRQCAGCRKLRHVSKADPRMARLLHEHPPLDRYWRWRLSETAQAYLLIAGRWLKRIFLVVDKETLEIRYLATRSRIRRQWDTVEPTQYAYVVRE